MATSASINDFTAKDHIPFCLVWLWCVMNVYRHILDIMFPADFCCCCCSFLLFRPVFFANIDENRWINIHVKQVFYISNIQHLRPIKKLVACEKKSAWEKRSNRPNRTYGQRTSKRMDEETRASIKRWRTMQREEKNTLYKTKSTTTTKYKKCVCKFNPSDMERKHFNNQCFPVFVFWLWFSLWLSVSLLEFLSTDRQVVRSAVSCCFCVACTWRCHRRDGNRSLLKNQIERRTHTCLHSEKWKRKTTASGWERETKKKTKLNN